MSDKDEKRIQLYLEDSREQLDGIENDILLLEKSESEVDEDLINRIFRSIHSVKGGAGFLGFKAIGKLSHAAEDVLNEIRNNNLIPNRESINTLLTASDTLKSMLDNPDESEQADISQLVTNLQRILRGESIEEEGSAEGALTLGLPDQGDLFSLQPEDLLRYQDDGFNLYLLEFDTVTDIEEKGKSKESLAEELESIAYLIDQTTLEIADRKLYYPLIATVLSEILTLRYLGLGPDQIHILAVNPGDLSQSQFFPYHPDDSLEFQKQLPDPSLEMSAFPLSPSPESENFIENLAAAPEDSAPAAFESSLESGSANSFLSDEPSSQEMVQTQFINDEEILTLEKRDGALTNPVTQASNTSLPTPSIEMPQKSETLDQNPAPAGMPAESASEAINPNPVEKETLPVESNTPSRPQASSYINQRNAAKPGKPNTKESDSSSKKDHVSSTIRVNVDILDDLMNLAGELVLTRNQLNQTVSLWDKYAIEIASQRLDSVTSELQETIMSTRMQPIGTVFNKFQRVVRDMSKRLNKIIDFTIEGEEVDLDKTIIENIGDPLTHLVRNAIDHGLETPEVRRSAGKLETGKLYLSARHEAGHVVIEIMDDGAGIDSSVIREKALEKGVVDKARLDEMSEKDINKLIFTPGFSTAKEVSDISGRGVGMDVVMTNLNQLGGTIDIDTVVGQGTSFKVKLPLTLAIIPSLLVQVNKENFAIPQVNLVELVRVPPAQVKQRLERVGDSIVIRLRGTLLPLIRLHDFLGIQEAVVVHPSSEEEISERRENLLDRRSEEDSKKYQKLRLGEDRRFHSASSVNIVVVSAGEFRYGIIVDTLMDSEEIVVKPLGYHLRECAGYAGATILGDGSAALILDVMGVANFMELGSQESHEREQKDRLRKAQQAVGNTQDVLIIENAKSEQFAVQLAFIHRIERIPSDRIQQVGNKNVAQYRGEALRLFSLEDALDIKPRAEGKYVYLIIFSMHDKEVAIMASGIVDIVGVDMEVDRVTFQQPGVVGSTIILDRITLLIDVFGIAKKLVPEWEQTHEEFLSTGPQKTVLMVEDTPFFRDHIRDILESQGLAVIEAVDGMQGLDVLYENRDKVDLILTDVEMPNMDGVEMTRRIREDPQFNHLKIVILTSLSAQEDRNRAEEAGADEYLVKIDQELLIKTTMNCLKK
ncbi:MAG: chemotaxis protein CheW [SAR324 cluster bacterium]|nr:chemotaxis protein CheW [SAR324 cluster bacterium]